MATKKHKQGRNILTDTFEQLGELGKTIIKETGRSGREVGQEAIGQLTGVQSESSRAQGEQKLTEQTRSQEKSKHPNSTPLDFTNLDKKYKEQEKGKEDAIRQRLHQLIKQGEGEVLEEDKRKKQEEEQQKVQEKEQKLKEEEEKRRMEDSGPALPTGKVQRSIFSRKKKATTQLTPEMKPAGSKN